MSSTTTTRLLAGSGHVLLATYDLADVGYVAEEWLLSGSASSYTPTSPPARHGRWDARVRSEAEFTTRLVVVRPATAERFDGTVVLEWLNVTLGEDAAAEWLYTHRHIVRSGSAWAGVSAQRAGVQGGGFLRGRHLLQADPERYAALRHPGDAYAFDIFSQAAAAVRSDDGPLAGLRVRTVLGVGASQSAMYLVTYVNAVDPLVQVIDGVLLHGRGAGGAWIGGTLLDPRATLTELLRRPRPVVPGPRIRSDARVPVLTVQTETDLVILAGALARQPDDERVRLWEIAGASHFDSYGLRAAFRDDGSLQPESLRHALRPVTSPLGIRTTAPINSGPQQHYVLQAALAALRRWVEEGVEPPCADPLATRRWQPLRLARSRSGTVLGGVRTPWVNAPVATLSGLGQYAPSTAVLMGSTRSWTEAQLAHRYPGGRSQYVEDFDAATRAAVDAGFLLAADEAEIRALGEVSWPVSAPPRSTAYGGGVPQAR